MTMKKLPTLLILLTLLTATTFAGVSLQWDPSPSPGIAHYNIYESPAAATNFTLLASPVSTNLVLTNPVFGTRYFATAVGTNQMESDRSNIVTNNLPVMPANARIKVSFDVTISP